MVCCDRCELFDMNKPSKKLHHGGDLVSASKQFGIPIEEWLDLSTGINPEPYPATEVPIEAFHRLPYLEDSFCDAVVSYYGSSQFLAVSGTQAAIQNIPSVLNQSALLPVLLPNVGYKEHELHWQTAGNPCRYYDALSNDSLFENIQSQLDGHLPQHLVLINPNNPTASNLTKHQVLALAEKVGKGGYVIVDEAFIDATPNESVLTFLEQIHNIIVLRSFGKFFGLAGIRLGFVFANSKILEALQSQLGIWQVNGPAQWLATRALVDTQWQEDATALLSNNAKSSRELLSSVFSEAEKTESLATPYFTSYPVSLNRAQTLFTQIAEEGVLTRVVDMGEGNALLRVGTFSIGNVPNRKRLQKLLNALEQDKTG